MQASTRRAIESLGASVRNRRKALGLSQRDVAEALGVTREYISQLERGEATRQLERLVALCHQLGLDLEAVPRRGRR